MLTVVYVDVLLFFNIIITYAVLTTAEKLFKRSTRLIRLLAAAFVGSLFSLLLFLGVRGFWYSLLLKAVSSLLITLIAFPFVSRREFFRTVLGVVVAGAVYSGLFILIYRLFKPPGMAIVNDTVYFEFNPLVMLFCTAVIYILIALFQKLFRERIKSTVVPLTFTVDGREYSCIGKVDTGCSLVEPFSGAPVIIADGSVMTVPEDAPRRVVPYSALGNASILFAVRAQQVSVDGAPIRKDVYIASGAVKNSGFQAIINSDILN